MMGAQFTCTSSAMKRAVQFAAQATERWNTIPILGMIKLECDGTSVTATGTDLDIECAATAEASGDVMGLCISPRFLNDILRGCEATDDITFEREGDILRITCGELKAEYRDLCPTEDWPPLSIGEPSGQAVTISEALLHKAFRAASICISTEETRYYLNGIFMHDKGEGLALVATDGHRLSLYKTGEQWGLGDAILPRKTCNILARAIRPQSNGEVAIVAHQKPLVCFAFKGEDWTIRSKSIDGTYPDYMRVIPPPEKELTATMTAASLRRIPHFGNGSMAVKLDMDAGRISSSCPADGISVSLPLSCTGKGHIGFNVKYLREFAAFSGTIKLEGKGSGDPCRVLFEDPAMLGVIMPMRV